MNTNRTGLAVITSHTSLTTVLIVLTLLRMLVTVVVVDSGGSSFPKIHGCGGRSRTSISRLRAWPATITHTPPCNTLRRRSASGSAPQRAIDVLRYHRRERPFDCKQLVFNAAQCPSRNVIMLGQFRQLGPLALYALLQLLQLPLLLRQQHVAVIDQALKLLSEVITNLLVYYFYQLVRETDRAYIALLHWVSLLCSFV